MNYVSVIPNMTSNSQNGFSVSGNNTSDYLGVDGKLDSVFRSSIMPTFPAYYTVTFPKKYLISRYSISLGYVLVEYGNMSDWEFQGLTSSGWETLHTGSHLKVAETLTFDFPQREVSSIRIKCNSRFGTNSWGFDELKVYEVLFSNVILFKEKNIYKKYNSSSWQTVTSATPTESDYLQGNTMSEIASIPESAWRQLTGTVELCYYTDDISITEAQFNIETNPFTLADEFKGKEIKVLEYTDNLLQAESKVETEVEPYSIYDEFGDTMEVLYYTDNTTRTKADLEITANYSPLDELEGDFEVVTWSDTIDETVQISIPQLTPDAIAEGTIYETPLNLENVVKVK